MRSPRDTRLIGLFSLLAVGCALSHHPQRDGGLNDGFGDRVGDSLGEHIDVPVTNDHVDVPPSDADGGCPVGTQLCGGTCVSVTAPDHCGTCGNDCTALPGVNAAAVTCSAGTCQLTCAAGRADCDPAPGCETDITTAMHCGSCTSTCSGGTPICAPGTGGMNSCTSGCSGTQQLCGTSCVDLATDPANCMTCGHACAAASHATVACMGGSCVSTCNTGYHDCSGTCVSDTATTSCGTMCTACPTPANSTPTCMSGACDFTCNTGFHRCGDHCSSSTDVLTCGTRCTACPAPSIGTAICTAGGACDVTCPAGNHRCASTMTCASDTDLMACGNSCSVCSAPANATPVCSATGCSFTCNTGYVSNGAGCVTAPPVCGNNRLETGETCDDGNTRALDGCNATCQMENAIVDSCSNTHTTIAIGDMGAHWYTGTTAGATSNSNACSAGGPDVIWQVTITLAGAFNYTVALTPMGGWHAIMRQDPTCPTATCVAPATPFGVVTYTAGGTGTVTHNFAADTPDTTGGPFTLLITTTP